MSNTEKKPGLYEGLGLVDSARTRRSRPTPPPSQPPLGYIVLARRPDSVEPVSAVFTGPKALEQAQNAWESCQAVQHLTPGTEYVIGEIRPT